MALSASQVWEVRTTGSDQNGGAFKAGATGTDYSVQDAAQIAVVDGVANGTTTLTSATAAFTAAHVGNVIYLAGGSGVLAAIRREVISVTNATTIVMDSSVSAGTGITLNLGGALASLGELASSTRGMVAGNKAFVKSGMYHVTVTPTFAQTVPGPSSSNPPSEIVGYKAVRGDITFGVNASSRPTIVTDSTILTCLQCNGQGWNVRNFIASPGTSTPSAGFTLNSANSAIHNCLVTAYTGGYGIYANGSNCSVYQCEVTGGVSAPVAGIYSQGQNNAVGGCYVHDGVGPGIYAFGNGTVFGNVVANMSGATSDGIEIQTVGSVIHNTVYNNGRHGISVASVNYGSLRVLGNVLSNNGGYGLTNLNGAGVEARAEWDGNAYYSNTSGNRGNFDDTTVNPVHGVAPYVNTFDVTGLSGSPFTNPSGHDFSLNATAGAGALLRGTSPFNAWPGLTLAGHRDFGAIQHQDAGGTTITTFIEG